MSCDRVIVLDELAGLPAASSSGCQSVPLFSGSNPVANVMAEHKKCGPSPERKSRKRFRSSSCSSSFSLFYLYYSFLTCGNVPQQHDYSYNIEDK